METTLRHLRTQTRRVQPECGVVVVMMCGVIYLTATAFLPDASVLRLHASQEDSRLWSSREAAAWTRIDVFPYEQRPQSRRNASENAPDGQALYRVSSWTSVPVNLVTDSRGLYRRSVSPSDSAETRNHGVPLGEAIAGNDESAVVEISGKGPADFVFPELNVSSLTSIDLSRVGQLNLLYFDTTRHPPQNVTSGQSFAKPRLEEYSQKGIGIAHQNVAEPVTLTDLHMAFQPIISHDERLLMLFVFQTFIRTCEVNNLTYFLYGGTLLGAYRHHDVVPWDDDVDVMMAAWQRPQVANILSSLPGFGVWTPRGRQWKFYWEGAPTLKHKRYRWPYIDIFFYKSNGTHIYDDSREYRADFRFPLTHVFPLQLRPFAGALLPVPCNMPAVLRVNYFPWLCATSPFLHKLESSAPRHLKARAACSRLFPLFHFVLRQKRDDFSVVETLIKGGKAISRTIMPAFCGEGGSGVKVGARHPEGPDLRENNSDW